VVNSATTGSQWWQSDNKGKNGKVFVLNINDIDKFSELQKGGKIFDE
jgi:hypothetical protein